MNVLTKDLKNHWATIRPILTIRNEREYELAIQQLNELLDEVGTNEQHPLYDLFDTLGTVVLAYEEDHHPMPEANPADMLRFFIEENELTQSDLPEIGSQGVVSEILSGKRELNVRKFGRWQRDFTFACRLYLVCSPRTCCGMKL